MTIETRFNINDLVQHKYQRAFIGGQAIAFEIIEIKAVNCYTTAQVFYVCRAIHAISDYDLKEKKRVVVDIVSGRPKDQEYMTFREDELKPCVDEIVKEILNAE